MHAAFHVSSHDSCTQHLFLISLYFDTNWHVCCRYTLCFLSSWPKIAPLDHFEKYREVSLKRPPLGVEKLASFQLQARPPNQCWCWDVATVLLTCSQWTAFRTCLTSSWRSALSGLSDRFTGSLSDTCSTRLSSLTTTTLPWSRRVWSATRPSASSRWCRAPSNAPLLDTSSSRGQGWTWLGFNPL